jgi:hemoglobin
MPRLSRLALLLPLLLTGCMESAKPTPLSRSLYLRLGGEDGITRLVDAFVTNVADNKDIPPERKQRFVRGDPGLKRELVEAIAEATGGPHTDGAKAPGAAPRGLDFAGKDFGAFVASFKRALADKKVGEAEQKELLEILGSYRGDAPEPSKGETNKP